MKNNLPQGVVCPCPGVIYMYIANILKALLKNPMTNQSQISCEASLGNGKEYINGPGHKTKMAATPIYIYGKNTSKIFFSRTGSPMILKLGMQYQGLKFYKVYMNVDLLNGKVTLGRLYVQMGKTVKKSFNENLQQKTKLTE